MSNIDKFKIIRQMYKNRNYNSEDDRFNAIYQKIMEYSNNERDDLEMIFKSDKISYERTMRLLGIIPLIISTLAMLLPICNAALKPENEVVSIVFGGMTVLAIIVFICIYSMCDWNIVRDTYLLYALDIAKKDSQEGHENMINSPLS